MSNTRKLKVPPKPVPLGKGSYAIYQTPEGEGLIAYRPDGDTQDSHQVIPRGIWQVMLQAMRGEKITANPLELLKMMMRHG